MFGYIYLLTNNLNGKVYVGQHIGSKFDKKFDSQKKCGDFLGISIGAVRLRIKSKRKVDGITIKYL